MKLDSVSCKHRLDVTHRKIPIISPGASFWSKSFSPNFSWGDYIGGVGGGGLYMDEYLRFENAIFCSSNCNFLRFSAHNLSLLLISFFLLFLKFCDPHCEHKLPDTHCIIPTL